MVIWPFRGIDLTEEDDGETLGWGGVGWRGKGEFWKGLVKCRSANKKMLE